MLDLIKISQRFEKNTMEDIEIDKVRTKWMYRGPALFEW